MPKRKFPNEINTKKHKIDEDEEIKQVYKLNFSLQFLSLASIAVQLWMHDNIQQAVARDLHAMRPAMDKQNAMKQIERRLSTRASTLHVPKRIYKLLLDPIKHVGLEIFNWVKYQDKLFRYVTHGEMDLVSVDYLNNVVWTPMGQVDYQKTARSFLSKYHFIALTRFKLACHYCLEEEMESYWNDVKSHNFREEKRIIRFWVAKLAGKSTRISVRDMFYEALLIGNETVGRFLWDRIGKLHCTVRYVYQLTLLHNANFMCFVLSQLSYQEQQKIFKSLCYHIVQHLRDDWLWKDHFLPTLTRMKKFMKTEQYWDLFKSITHSLESCTENWNCTKCNILLSEVWECSPREEMFRNNRVLFCDCIAVVCRLYQRKYINTLIQILSDVDSLDRKNILLTRMAIHKCKSFLINKDWDLLEVFIQHTCESEEDLNNLEIILEPNILSYLTKEEWNLVKQFFKLSFGSPEKINKFKRELVYRDNENIKKLVKSYFVGDVDVYEIEHYLKWFLPSEEGLNEFKSTMFLNEPLCHSMFELVFEYLGKDQFDSIDFFLNWSFSNCQDAIYCFKMDLLSKGNENYILDLFLNWIKNDNLQSLIKFITWCSTNEETQRKFKSIILNVQSENLGVCGSLLLKRKYKLADEVIAWCCCFSEVEIYIFKNKYMLRVFQSKFLFESIVLNEYRQGYQMLKNLLKWFNSSTETITKCKASQEVNIPKRVFQILDYYIRENAKRRANFKSSVSAIAEDSIIRQH